jgi:amino acid transporter
MATSKPFKEKFQLDTDAAVVAETGSVDKVTAGSQHLRRKLRGKEVQLFAIGGAIETCKFIRKRKVGG